MLAEKLFKPPKPPVVYTNPLRITFRNIVLGVIIGSLIVAILVLSISYFTAEPQVGPNFISQRPKTTPSATIATPSSQKDETAGWKIYKDSEFTVIYPTDWVASDVSPNSSTHQVRVESKDTEISILFATNFPVGPDLGPAENTKSQTKISVFANGKNYNATESVRKDDGKWYLSGGESMKLYFEAFSKSTPNDAELSLIKNILATF